MGSTQQTVSIKFLDKNDQFVKLVHMSCMQSSYSLSVLQLCMALAVALITAPIYVCRIYSRISRRFSA